MIKQERDLAEKMLSNFSDSITINDYGLALIRMHHIIEYVASKKEKELKDMVGRYDKMIENVEKADMIHAEDKTIIFLMREENAELRNKNELLSSHKKTLQSLRDAILECQEDENNGVDTVGEITLNILDMWV